MGLSELFPKLPKRGAKVEILPMINAVAVTLLFLYFYQGNLEYVLTPLAVAWFFGGKIRDNFIRFFIKSISQGAHLLVCLVLVGICAYIFGPRLYKEIMSRISKI